MFKNKFLIDIKIKHPAVVFVMTGKYVPLDKAR